MSLQANPQWGVWNAVFEEWIEDDNKKDWTGTREQAVKLEAKMRADGARGIEVKEYDQTRQ